MRPQHRVMLEDIPMRSTLHSNICVYFYFHTLLPSLREFRAMEQLRKSRRHQTRTARLCSR
jgi:hypothetical protein